MDKVRVVFADVERGVLDVGNELGCCFASHFVYTEEWQRTVLSFFDLAKSAAAVGENYLKTIVSPAVAVWENYLKTIISPAAAVWENYLKTLISPAAAVWENYLKTLAPPAAFWENYLKTLISQHQVLQRGHRQHETLPKKITIMATSTRRMGAQPHDPSGFIGAVMAL